MGRETVGIEVAIEVGIEIGIEIGMVGTHAHAYFPTYDQAPKPHPSP